VFTSTESPPRFPQLPQSQPSSTHLNPVPSATATTHNLPQPTSTTSIATMAANQAHFLRIGLRKIEVGDTPTDCTICLEESQLGQELHQIRACGHAFHERCLLDWLNSKNTHHSSCPICRQELFPARVSRDAELLNQTLSVSL
jgi:hypothetical protein